MLRRRPLKYLVLVVGLWLMAGSCFQFRQSDARQLAELQEIANNYSVDIGMRTFDSTNLHYTYVTDDTAKPLAVFVHGSPGSSSNFLQYAKDTVLLQRYSVLLVDRPGFGYSDFGNAEPEFGVQANLLNQLVRSFPNEERILIGHSLGGPIICRMAMNDTTIAAGLLIVAGSVSPELEPNEKWRPFMDRRATRWVLPRSFRASNVEIISAEQQLDSMRPLWQRITADVKIIQGMRDKLVPPGNEDYAEEQLVNARSVEVKRYEELDHFIPFRQPELVTSCLLRFRFE